jgi:hypothetical protein
VRERRNASARGVSRNPQDAGAHTGFARASRGVQAPVRQMNQVLNPRPLLRAPKTIEFVM